MTLSIPGTNPFRKRSAASIEVEGEIAGAVSADVPEQDPVLKENAQKPVPAKPPAAPPRRVPTVQQQRQQQQQHLTSSVRPVEALDDEDMRALDELERAEAADSDDLTTTSDKKPVATKPETPARPPPPRSRSSTVGSQHSRPSVAVDNNTKLAPPQPRAHRSASVVNATIVSRDTTFDPSDELADLQRQIDSMMSSGKR